MDYEKVEKFIKRRRARGASNSAILKQLTSSGYDPVLAKVVIEDINARQAAAVSAKRAKPNRKARKLQKKRKKTAKKNQHKLAERSRAKHKEPRVKSAKYNIRTLVLVLIVVAIAAFVATVYVERNRQFSDISEFSTETYNLFSDPKFELLLPNNWEVNDGYKPGADSVIFSKPGPTIGGESDASISVFWEPSETNNINTRIDYQLSSIKANGGSYRSIADRIEEMHGYARRYVELVLTPVDNPASSIHLITMTVAYGTRFYYVDIKVPETNWSFYQDTITRITNTFAPRGDMPYQ